MIYDRFNNTMTMESEGELSLRGSELIIEKNSTKRTVCAQIKT